MHNPEASCATTQAVLVDTTVFRTKHFVQHSPLCGVTGSREKPSQFSVFFCVVGDDEAAGG
jgi:hypothetical protein